jgi:chromate transporter
MKKYWSLFFTMLKIGLFTFGGGYAMIALLENEFVEKKKYMEKDEFLDMVAIAESTPGPIAINAATYIGYKRAGVLGSAITTVGVCIPSFTIIYVISLLFDSFLSFKFVEYAFRGIQVCVIYLIFSAGLKLLVQMK